MRIVIYVGHPAHYHLHRRVISRLRDHGHEVRVIVSKKDVLLQLLDNDGMDYSMVGKAANQGSRLRKLYTLWRRGKSTYRYLRKYRPDVIAGTSPEGPLAAKLAGVPYVNFNEDDYDVVPLYSHLAYPFASCIMMPEGCRAGKWERKTVFYPGFHELSYLHPDIFQADKAVVREHTGNHWPYILLRFSALNAHHDRGKRGLTESLAKRIIELAGEKYRVLISSEKELPSSLSGHLLNIDPLEMHHFMAFATVYIGDSQTMAAECAMLGTPFIRYNDFIGKITYLEQLENKYKLGFGFKPGQEEQMLEKLDEILNQGISKGEWESRRKEMLQSKLNVSEFLAWFLGHYPESAGEVKNAGFSWSKFF